MEIVKKLFSFILFLISVFLIINLFSIDIIPNKYLYLIIFLCLLINIIFLIFSFKKTKKLLSIILIILSIIFSVIESFGIYYIYHTNKFFENISEITEKSIYYIVVNNESNYQELKDLDNKKLGIIKMQSDTYTKAIDILFESVSMEKFEYDSFKKLVNDLYESEIDCFIINSSNFDLLEENIEDFKDKVKIIDKITIEKEKQEIEIKKEEDSTKPFNLFISGIDVNGPIETSSRSDVNIVVTVNPNTHKILLTHIPRDYYVCLHGIENGMDKLTHAGMYGIDMSVKTVEDVLSIDIDYYLRVNFDTLIKVVDAIGGIDVYSDASFMSSSGIYFYEGINHMNGKQALAFSRERKSFEEGDRRRGKHQEEVIEAIFKKVSSSSVLLTNYSEILGSISNSFQTNLSESLIKEFIKKQLESMPAWTTESISVNGSDYAAYNTYSLPDWYLYLVYPDQDTINFAHDKIMNVLNGN